MLMSIGAILLGFVLLTKSADYFINGASSLATILGVPPLIIGLTIVGFGSSAPEILVSSMAAWQNNPMVGLGNAVGSNITNIALVLGATAIVRPIVVKSGVIRSEYPVMFGAAILTWLLVLDHAVSGLDGIILVSVMVALTLVLIISGLKPKAQTDSLASDVAAETEETAASSLGKATIYVVGGLVVLLGSSKLLVWGAVNVATYLGISELVIGLTIVAIGTSLPELAASISSVKKDEFDIAIGNIVGSNIINILVVFGLPGIIAPTSVGSDLVYRDFGVMLGLTALLMFMAYRRDTTATISRVKGMTLLILYSAYLITLGIMAPTG